MNTRRTMRTTVAILGGLAAGANAWAQTPAPAISDPRVGIWNLNVAKSTYKQGKAPQMQVRKVEARPDGFYVFTLVGVDAQGAPTFAQTTYKLDGTAYPEYSQTSTADLVAAGTKPPVTIVFKVVDPLTVEAIRYDASGTVQGGSKQVLSEDGKVLTSTSPVATTVWEKQ
jgi:hypothetical protein